MAHGGFIKNALVETESALLLSNFKFRILASRIAIDSFFREALAFVLLGTDVFGKH